MLQRNKTQDLREKLVGETAESRYSALKEVVAPEAALSLAPQLLEICLSDDWGPNRSEAARALELLWPDPEVQKAFCACLDAEPYVANTVVELLAARMDAPAVVLLRSRFEHADNAKLRYSILQAFCNAPDELTGEFIVGSGSLRDEDERIRALSISLLGRSANPSHKPLFVERLKDDSQRVRAGAVEALSAICSPEEILVLLPPCLEDTSNRVRANALIPLLGAGYRLAEATLREMVTHTSNFFRSSAAYVLGELAPTRGVVSQLDDLTRDPDELVRRRALVSVERLALKLPAPLPLESTEGLSA